MNLILDVGNSFAKLAVFQSDELLRKETVEKEQLQEKAEEILTSFPEIGKIILSKVAAADFFLPEHLQERLDLVQLGPETAMPFENLYATPLSLGNDRKALVAAASKYHPNNNILVIDAGTCLTFDFKNDRNQYLGGAISPGLRMRYKALNSFTSNLPLVEPLYEVPLIGDSTLNSINSGVYLGMTREIAGIIEEYRAVFRDLIIIFTGGDAQILSIRLKNGIFANSNFLLEGLNYILEINTSQ